MTGQCAVAMDLSYIIPIICRRIFDVSPLTCHLQRLADELFRVTPRSDSSLDHSTWANGATSSTLSWSSGPSSKSPSYVSPRLILSPGTLSTTLYVTYLRRVLALLMKILRLLSLWPLWVCPSYGTSLLVDDTTTVPEATSTNTLLKRRNPMNHKRRHRLSAVQHAPMSNASTRRPLAGSVHVMTLKTQLFNQRAYFAIL